MSKNDSSSTPGEIVDAILEQPLPKTEVPNPLAKQENVFDHLISTLRSREELGRQRYGQSLSTFNGRSALIDLQQECLDALVYIEQVKMEQKYVREVLENIRTLVEVRSFLTDAELAYISKAATFVLEVLYGEG